MNYIGLYRNLAMASNGIRWPRWIVTYPVSKDIRFFEQLEPEVEANARNRRHARENACEQVAISFGFTSGWLRKWRAFFFSLPVTEYSRVKPNQTRVSFED